MGGCCGSELQLNRDSVWFYDSPVQLQRVQEQVHCQVSSSRLLFSFICSARYDVNTFARQEIFTVCRLCSIQETRAWTDVQLPWFKNLFVVLHKPTLCRTVHFNSVQDIKFQQSKVRIILNCCNRCGRLPRLKNFNSIGIAFGSMNEPCPG